MLCLHADLCWTDLPGARDSGARSEEVRRSIRAYSTARRPPIGGPTAAHENIGNARRVK